MIKDTKKEPNEGSIPDGNKVESTELDQAASSRANEETSEDLQALADEFERLPLDDQIALLDNASPAQDAPTAEQEEDWVYEDPSESDDGQGEWITPGNVALHKSRALDLLPDAASKSKSKKRKAPQPERVEVGCMTADYAMQNVLMHMGLNLVGVEGTRISSVKSWVLRCHACFK